jgi:hypothetical protein
MVSVNSYVGMGVERGEFFIPNSRLDIFKPHAELKLDLNISKIIHQYITCLVIKRHRHLMLRARFPRQMRTLKSILIDTS